MSVHAVGGRGTAPLGWALYLPEDWCDDPGRRAKAKIPASVVFQSKPELGVELVEQASGWDIPAAPVLGDAAYGDNTSLRDRLDQAGSAYVLAVGAAKFFAPETVFAVPEQSGRQGRPWRRLRPDREPETVAELIARIGSEQARTVAFRDGPGGEPVSSPFVFVAGVRAAHEWQKGSASLRREELLIAEWPEGADEPVDYWITNLPADTDPERLARLCRLRWKIELDYRQLKGELGLDHYEGRSWIGWHHHTALVTVAHGFLTLERLCPRVPRLA